MSESPRASDVAAASSDEALWFGRSLQAGVSIGTATGAVAQAVLWVWGRGPSVLAGLAAVLLSITFFTTLSIVLALLLSPLRRFKGGRLAAAAVVSFFVALLAACDVAMVGVHIFTGSFPPPEALQMLAASPGQFIQVAMATQPRLVGLLGALTLGIGLATAALLGRQRAKTEVARRAALALTLALSVLIALFVGAPVDSPLEVIREATPELALFPRPVPPEPPSLEPAVVERTLSGPPLSAGQEWLSQVRAGPVRKPNVILLMLESVPANHLGYAGYQRPVTPNLDALAAKALHFPRVWSTSSHSNYAQMAILSSLLPRRRDGLDMYTRLDYPRVLFHDVFASLGYSTATISSQDENWQGMRRFQNTGTPTYFWDSHDFPGPHMEDDHKVPDEVTVDVLLKWLEQPTGKPWAVYVNLQRTHFSYLLPPGQVGPFQPSEPEAGKFGYLAYPRKDRETVINRYDNALRYVDAQVGRIAAYLKQRGELENTLWIVTSDHGEVFFEHGEVTHGKTLYEGETRVPWFVHWPAQVKPGSVDVPASHLDLMPTVLGMLGLPAHPSYQGRDLLKSKRPPGPTPGIFLTMQGLRHKDAVVCWPLKLIVDRGTQVHRLFDLQSDPGEREDISGREPQATAALSALLQEQILTQLLYHAPQQTTRAERYAPRVAACPLLTQDGRTLGHAEQGP
jgi:arylsulfatase A-like enzyme